MSYQLISIEIRLVEVEVDDEEEEEEEEAGDFTATISPEKHFFNFPELTTEVSEER